jgi:hypothetical protein
MPGVPHRLFDTGYIEKIEYLSHISIATQTLSDFLLDHYVVSIPRSSVTTIVNDGKRPFTVTHRFVYTRKKTNGSLINQIKTFLDAFHIN